MGENGREHASLFPNNVHLTSDHYRVHLLEVLERYGDFSFAERATELKNQEMIGLYNKTKRMRSDSQKETRVQMLLAGRARTEAPQPMFRKKPTDAKRKSRCLK